MRSACNAVAIVLVGCGASPLPDPTIDAITPSLVMTATDPVHVVITGTSFFLPVATDLDRGELVLGDIEATVGGVPLVDLVWRDNSTLEGTVPPGLAEGMHDVAVRFGDRADTLEGGYSIVIRLPEVTSVRDPFGDGSPFGYVVGYRNQVYVGPNRTGSAAVRMNADGTGLQQLSFTFTRDITNNTSSNSAGTYTSIGYTGCTANTSACGPDNENGRGLFAAGTLDGMEWLVIGGARTGGDLDYVYMTNDADTTLDFQHVDLSQFLGGMTRGFSSMIVAGTRAYFGFPDNGGARPYLVSLFSPPPPGGLDATTTHAVNMEADKFPNWQDPGTAMVDSMVVFNDRLYVASAPGLMGATQPDPRPFGVSSSDWQEILPAIPAFTDTVGRTTTKVADLSPSDRAWPQMAVFGDHLFAGRNTTAGPQLLACDPTISDASDRCQTDDWRHVAPNSTGNSLLTQFNDPTLTSISMVVATQQYLYIGFDSINGVRVFRTTNPAARLASDFASYDTPGLGFATDTKILDAKALTFTTGAEAWATVGNGTDAMRLVRLR